ncbi:FAD-binding monooxygenase [Mycolicibacter minnesotensis]|uniref:FAD-binding monooxygenase n=1 Tax=Mycolicibacter minnesotensis TaxID=1118379 RepID=A0A7I7R5W4_9MYCO|nr:FAD-dependent oxidoreductase [Mycolicibacter minnesotensis]ORB03729.1 FAD-binding monooxygenase [Mycolicibacter minnesotensis]BBY33991.1 salicylate hydroxylase [Mycolicibacter minnesotensis]
MNWRIGVVGAGIAGLATAIGLQRRGHDVTVIEQRTDTSSGAGISIWPNALAALDHLGLGDAVRAAGGGITAGAARWHDGSWLRRPETERIVRALGEPLVVVQRSALRDVLTHALPVGAVEYGLAATAVTTAGDVAQLHFSDGSTRTFDAVVGADGTNSAVARHLNGPLSQRYVGYTAWRGVAAYALDPDLAGKTLGPGVETGHIPMGPDLTYWFATERAPEPRRAPEDELAYLRAKFARWADPLPGILAATDPSDVLRDDLYDRSPARCWARGPILLVGDAAHPMRPHLGQGGCQGLEDAAILAEFVGQEPDLPTAFTRFASFRRRRVASVVRESAWLGRAVNVRSDLLSAVISRSSAMVPEFALMRHMASIAARTAFVLPPGPSR